MSREILAKIGAAAVVLSFVAGITMIFVGAVLGLAGASADLLDILFVGIQAGETGEVKMAGYTAMAGGIVLILLAVIGAWVGDNYA